MKKIDSGSRQIVNETYKDINPIKEQKDHSYGIIYALCSIPRRRNVPVQIRDFYRIHAVQPKGENKKALAGSCTARNSTVLQRDNDIYDQVTREVFCRGRSRC